MPPFGNKQMQTCCKNVNNLIKIDLSFNQIQYIEDKTFAGLINLSEINLSNNQLTSIETNMFNGLAILNIIDLEYNQITSINSRSSKLKNMRLKGNFLYKNSNLKKNISSTDLIESDNAKWFNFQSKLKFKI